MNIAIIGAGLIGRKRASAIKKIKGMKVAGACDVIVNHAQSLVDEFGGKVYLNWQDVVSDKKVDAVAVATSHNWLATISLGALKNKKHVLVEKPGATKLSDLKRVYNLAKKNKVSAWVGFNHRYHPAVLKTRKILNKKTIGPILYARAVYGHGGRAGYDKEWRADPKLSGGGELLDQGSHIIDLCHLFIGEMKLSHATLKTFFWNMPVEDNAFLVLQSKKDQLAFLHASWTQWKNRFTFEIFGKKGALVIDGLGGSYGTESLTLYQRPPQGGKPKEKKWHWEGSDNSFLEETKAFYKTTKNAKNRYKSIEDSIRNLNIIDAIYSKK